jgi:uncharacterized tellurite resistance protein B-like protein
MFDALRDFFDNLAPSGAQSGPKEQALRLAVAVLLMEVMRAHDGISRDERAAAQAALRERFALDEAQMASLLEQAETESRQAYDYYRFTHTINESLSQPQKVALVEALWRVAYADGHLDVHENAVISKVADLLHVTHGEYIAGKIRAQP